MPQETYKEQKGSEQGATTASDTLNAIPKRVYTFEQVDNLLKKLGEGDLNVIVTIKKVVESGSEYSPLCVEALMEGLENAETREMCEDTLVKLALDYPSSVTKGYFDFLSDQVIKAEENSKQLDYEIQAIIIIDLAIKRPDLFKEEKHIDALVLSIDQLMYVKTVMGGVVYDREAVTSIKQNCPKLAGYLKKTLHERSLEDVWYLSDDGLPSLFDAIRPGKLSREEQKKYNVVIRAFTIYPASTEFHLFTSEHLNVFANRFTEEIHKKGLDEAQFPTHLEATLIITLAMERPELFEEKHINALVSAISMESVREGRTGRHADYPLDHFSHRALINIKKAKPELVDSLKESLQGKEFSDYLKDILRKEGFLEEIEEKK